MVSSHQEAVASFEAGCTTRAMINAVARSRCRPAGPSRPGRSSAAAWAHTAATCPCGMDRVTVAAWSAGTRLCPFNPASTQSITCAGSADRFATVSLRTLPPSRNVRRRYAEE